MLSEELDRPIEVSYGDWRPGDQRVYISDIGKARAEMGWVPEIGARAGVRRLLSWIRENERLFTAK